MRAPILTAVVLLAAGLGVVATGSRPAAAADRKHDFAVHGIGALSCAQLDATAPANALEVRNLLASWLMGYISAVNRIQPGTYDATPVQDQNALVNMVAGVCGKNPNARVETVSSVVLQSLEKAKLTAESPEVTVTVGKNSTVLRQDTLKRLERVLVEQKDLPAREANGETGNNLQIALIKFQTAQKLPQTGLPDPATVVRALIELKS
jgi:hypothetical protein